MNRFRFLLVILLPFIFLHSEIKAQDKVVEADFDSVIPKINSLVHARGKYNFVLNRKTRIYYSVLDKEAERLANVLRGYIIENTGMRLGIGYAPYNHFVTSKILLLTSLKSPDPEAYSITVQEEFVVLRGASNAGLFRAVQTLRKAIPVVKTDSVIIKPTSIMDYPRFKWRGMMLDCSRHFFSIDFIKEFIDILALHNCNVFHWHLSDDQGWRPRLQKYPLLSIEGGERNETVIGRNSGVYDGRKYGGSYQKEDIREIVDYAAKNYITIVPEIDMPGHMQAALSAYPWLGCTGKDYKVWTKWGVSENVLCVGKETTFEFVENVLSEIMDLFPSKVIHIGGDECPVTRWKECPDCQAKIKELGLVSDSVSAERKLQNYFTERVEKFVNSHGKKVIGWDEILEGKISNSAMIMSWRGESGGIKGANNGHDVVMSPYTYLYFDYRQSKGVNPNEPVAGGYNPVSKVYSFEPVSEAIAPDARKHIIGVQANLWTEYVKDERGAEYMILPRIAALSEVQWTLPKNKDYQSFVKHAAKLAKLYDLQDYNYATQIFDGTE